jgi:hypothetical protein
VAAEEYLDVAQDAEFYRTLHRIDREMAHEVQSEGCPACRGPLHAAYYRRAARGGPHGLPDDCRLRFSLCCGRKGCRQRLLPPSCLFFGRRWYFGVVVLLVPVLRRQKPVGTCIEQLTLWFGVSRATVVRWLSYFRKIFPRTPLWQRARGRVSAEVSNDLLPDSLIAHVRESGASEALLSVVKLFAGCQARSSGVDPFHARNDFIGSTWAS